MNELDQYEAKYMNLETQADWLFHRIDYRFNMETDRKKRARLWALRQRAQNRWHRRLHELELIIDARGGERPYYDEGPL